MIITSSVANITELELSAELENFFRIYPLIGSNLSPAEF